MNTLAQTVDAEADLEAHVAEVVSLTVALAKAGQKNRLRRAFVELAGLKARRNPMVIHRLDFERGLVDLP